jgi:hypothetical protein
VGLADCEASNGIARKIEVDKLARTLAAQTGVRATLHDSEKRLPWIGRGLCV